MGIDRKRILANQPHAKRWRWLRNTAVMVVGMAVLLLAMFFIVWHFFRLAIQLRTGV